MNDSSLAIMLMVCFGLAGLVLLVAGWLMPYLASERVFVTIGGGGGVGFAAVRGLLLRRRRSAAAKPLPVKADVP